MTKILKSTKGCTIKRKIKRLYQVIVSLDAATDASFLRIHPYNNKPM